MPCTNTATLVSRQVLKDQAKDLAKLRDHVGIPRNLTSIPGTGILYWLAGLKGQIFAVDTKASQLQPRKLDWLASHDTSKDAKPISNEEEQLRERIGLRTSGISNLAFHKVKEISWCFYSAGFGIRLCRHMTTGKIRDLTQEFWQSLTDSTGATGWLPEGSILMDIKHSPVNPFCLSMVVNNNLLMAAFPTGDEQQPSEGTTIIHRLTTLGTDKLLMGTPDYIMQEEFSMISGQWWSLDGTRIAFLTADTTMLETATYIGKHFEMRKMQYPKPGELNATQALCVVRVDAETPILTAWPRAAMLQIVPWMEYMVRVDWRDGQHVHIILTNRDQSRVMHLLLDTATLPEVSESNVFSDTMGLETELFSGIKMTVLWERHFPDAWYEVPTDFYTSAEGGEFHITHNTDSPEGPQHFQLMHRPPCPSSVHLKGFSRHSAPFVLPSQEWSIARQSLHITKAGDVFFCGFVHDMTLASLCHIHAADFSEWRAEVVNDQTEPTEPNVHVLSKDTEYVTSFHVLTNKDGSPEAVGYVWSSVNTAPSITLLNLTESTTSPIVMRSKVPNLDSIPTVTPSFHWYHNARGVKLPYCIYKPPNHPPPTAGYPLMLYVYGGPHAQLIHKTFSSRCSVVLQMLIANGIAVAVVDNQQAFNLGLRDLKIVHRNMGCFETEDYKAAVKHLTEQSDIPIDPTRVGIYGHSYGGYSSLLAMCQAPEVFKMGIAGAPTADYKLYDTGYTERYMGTLPENEEAYTRGSMMVLAQGFPDDMHRVFVLHGSGDDNVHLSHTFNLINAMVAHNKPFNLVLYPGQPHRLMDNASQTHSDVTINHIFLQHL